MTEELFFWSSLKFGPKTGLNLGEDLFFWSSLNFGQENGLGFGLENFHSGLHYSQNSQIFLPPPFENPAYATGLSSLLERVPRYVPTSRHGF